MASPLRIVRVPQFGPHASLVTGTAEWQPLRWGAGTKRRKPGECDDRKVPKESERQSAFHNQSCWREDLREDWRCVLIYHAVAFCNNGKHDMRFKEGMAYSLSEDSRPDLFEPW